MSFQSHRDVNLYGIIIYYNEIIFNRFTRASSFIEAYHSFSLISVFSGVKRYIKITPDDSTQGNYPDMNILVFGRNYLASIYLHGHSTPSFLKNQSRIEFLNYATPMTQQDLDNNLSLRFDNSESLLSPYVDIVFGTSYEAFALIGWSRGKIFYQFFNEES